MAFSKYKFYQVAVSSLIAGSNDVLELQVGGDSELYGIRLEITAGSLSSFDLKLECKGDSLTDSFEKIYPFEDFDLINMDDSVKDVEFLKPLILDSGDTVRVNLNNLTGLSGTDALEVTLYYI